MTDLRLYGRLPLRVGHGGDPWRGELAVRGGVDDVRGADRVRPGAVGDVVDPAPPLHLDDPPVLAGEPVEGARPTLLPAVLTLHHPPVSLDLLDLGDGLVGNEKELIVLQGSCTEY